MHRRSYQNGCEIFAQQKNVFLIILENIHTLLQQRLRRRYIYIYIYIYRAYGDFKDLIRRTLADKVLCDKAVNMVKNSKYDEYQRGLASMVYKFFDEDSFLIRTLHLQIKLMQLVVLKKKSCKIRNYLKNFTNQLFKEIEIGKYTYVL